MFILFLLCLKVHLPLSFSSCCVFLISCIGVLFYLLFLPLISDEMYCEILSSVYTHYLLLNTFVYYNIETLASN